MATLVIETATAACGVALIDAGACLHALHEVVGRGHAERLVPMIGAVLTEAGCRRAAAVLVDCGPGSFTGIRVGLAAARALGLAWGAPVLGYSALALIAAGHDGDAAAATTAITGGHGEIFVQRFALRPLEPLDEMRSLAPDVAARAIPDILVLGSGAEALVAARGWGRAVPRLPRAADAVLLPSSLAERPPRPLYGRAPDAVPAR